MYKTKEERKMIKECQAEFNRTAGKMLLEKGFKKKKETYWRVVGDEILQVAVFGIIEENNYHIFFDMRSLYVSFLCWKIAELMNYHRLMSAMLLMEVILLKNSSTI